VKKLEKMKLQEDGEDELAMSEKSKKKAQNKPAKDEEEDDEEEDFEVPQMVKRNHPLLRVPRPLLQPPQGQR
jgi:hypothetical protein